MRLFLKKTGILCLLSLLVVANARPLPENILNVNAAKDPANEILPTEDSEDLNPSEIQKAVCTITAGEVKASAEAVTTKTLKGVCGSNEMNRAFQNLESTLTKQLESIKDLLSSTNPSLAGGCSCNSISSQKPNIKSMVKLQPIPSHNNNEITKAHSNSIEIQNKPINSKGALNSKIPREREVLTLNNTLLSEKDLKIFTYYWKIENFTKKLENGSPITTIHSPTFFIKGKIFKIKASFQHLHRDFLFLQLEDASGFAKSSGNSIILDTGGLFKEILNDTFKFKLSVLDQNAERSKDLVSQEFDNYDTGFLIPNSALLDSPFIKDDSLLIKILLYP